jgi:hypothetical protein
MAKESEGTGGPHHELKPDDIIERLVPDPANPRVTKLVGLYLGNSSRTEYWRLYLSASLDHYFEFRKDDTLDSTRLSTDEIVVWLKPDAKVEETRTTVVPEAFLRGDIAARLGQLRQVPPILRPLLAVADSGSDRSCVWCESKQETGKLSTTCSTSCPPK